MKFYDKNRMSRMGIVLISAALVEVISILQYKRVRDMMLEEMSIRSKVVIESMVNEIGNTLECTEVTMRENLWYVQRCLSDPDSVFQAMAYLIDDNPHLVGSCLAFIPDYFPDKGRLFEPYASKGGGITTLTQLAGPGHDYTEHPAFQDVLESESPVWSDPYFYGPDSLCLVTYSYPVEDREGRIAAVCGLDIDVSWLGDTLNVHQPFPSSFALLLTQDGDLVASPPAWRTPPSDVAWVLSVLSGKIPQPANSPLSIRTAMMSKPPYWQVVQVYKTDEVFTRMRRMRRQQMLLILLGLAVLAFMINRYARNEKKLQLASEERARMGGELEVARNIQKEMLPKTFPPFVYGSVEPAREVGGDLFDFFVRDGKLFFCIGDVSGKGAPAAMLMSMIHSLFRLVSQKEESPSRILSELNREHCRSNDSNMFITFFVGCLDLYTGVLNFGNAGHDKPFVLTDDIVLLKTKANLPLGVFPDTHFEEQTCTLAPGTILFLYTDGLTEAKNTSRKLFGREGVTEVLKSCLSSGRLAPENLVSALSEAAHRFAGEEPQSDDLTMLLIRFEPGEIIQDRIELTTDVKEISRLNDFVKAFCARLDIDRRTASGMRLALEETVVNIIQYAYPWGDPDNLTVLADSNRKEVRFTVIDSGIPFDPTSALEADTTLDAKNRQIGGLGILLARKLMDTVSYVRRDGLNVLTLTKYLS